MTSSFVRAATVGRVRVLTIENPPVNALSEGVPERIMEAVTSAETDEDVAAVVLIGGGRTFVAGADISMLEALAWDARAPKPDLRPLLAHIERASKPIVMAIHGTALGGGLELAMAGHFRVAVASAKVGLPECALGIIPGAEGTQRLPRLAGVEKALNMVVSARPIGAVEALEHGIIDAIVPDDLLDGAVAFATHVLATGMPIRRTSERDDRLGTPLSNAPLYEQARALARKIRPHQTAPPRAIDAIEAASRLPFAEGSDRETTLFLACVQSEQAKALIHVFFAERAVNKIPDVPKDVKARPVARVGIIGAGTMGSGIAMACANAGLDVRLQDASPEGLERGVASVRRNYATSVTRGRFTEQDVVDRMARITPQTDLRGFDQADIIIEAAFEDMALKQRLFVEMDKVARPGCILATNTSTLDIDAMAAVTSRPTDVIGLHFFSPANVMRLLEIVRGHATSPEALATAMAFAKLLGKVGVVVGNGPGFVGNRMMFPYMYETQFLVEEGATPQQVDEALVGFGMAMGMFAVDDMAGIDVAIRAQRALGHFSDPAERKPLVQPALVEAGRLGQKTGRGWYSYGENRKASADPEVLDLIRTRARAAGIIQRSFTAEDIIERSVYALINEGARALEAGLALRASDIDVIYVNGYGFPAWRGGPMFFADRAGLGRILERIQSFHRDFGARWAPAPLLEELVRTGGTFRERDRHPA